MAQIDAAIAYLKAQEHPNYAEAGRRFEIEPTTLRRRFLGLTTSRAAVDSEHRQLLNNDQEAVLLSYIDRLTDRYIPPTTQIIRNLAQELLGKQPGKNWTAGFVQRHKSRICSIYLRPLDRTRVSAENTAVFEHFYRLLDQAITKYNLEPSDIYNWDEKGFLIGRANIRRRIMTKEAYKSGRIRHTQEDGNREFISLLACVCADGTALPPALIYQGKSGDLQNTWMEDLKEGEEAYFTSAENGWSSDALGLAWLRRFDQNTRHKNSRRRLLIVDGHSSHINWGLVSCAEELRILVLILPPHTTHRLQPLDVCLFSPLSTAYSNQLLSYTHGGRGWVSMTKRMFWTLFKVAWKESFTVKNIKKSFEKTGIQPFDKLKIIKVLQKPEPTLPTPSQPILRPIATPLTCRGVRNLIRAPPTDGNAALLRKVTMKLATHLELKNHEIGNLCRAFGEEKKKRHRHKRLNLLGEEANGAPQFFSPTRVLAAREFQEGREAAEEEERRQKTQQKEDQARQRLQKEADQQEQKLQRQMRQQLNREQKAIEKAEKEAEREAKKLERQQIAEAKAAAIAERKKKQQKRKDDAAADLLAAATENSSEHASAAFPKTAKTQSNRSKKVAPRIRKPAKMPPSKRKGAATTAAATVTVAVVPAQIRTRSGRTITTPARFEETV